MKRIQHIILLVLGLCFLNPLMAQQEPTYSQYLFNGFAINPAYAGSRNGVSGTFLYRRQWLGLKGAPNTQTIAVHAPVGNRRHGIGFSALRDEISITRTYRFNAAYAYRVPLGKGDLALGIQAVLINYRADANLLTIEDPSDQAIGWNNVNRVLPNAGAGVYYSTDRWFVGFAVPNVIPLRLSDEGTLDQRSLVRQHFFLNGGMWFPAGENLKIFPSAMVKYVWAAPPDVDVNLSFIIIDKFWVGAGFRTFDAIAFSFQWYPTAYLRVGYAYDVPVGRVNGYTSGSHELMIGFDLGYRKKVSKKMLYDGMDSPRFF